MNGMSARNLNLWYGEKQALKNINLDMPEKQITALIGPSGCGKSTFLRSLNRMHDLYRNIRIEGTVTLNGKDIYKEMSADDLRTAAGMVFQRPNPFGMSVYDNVAYGPRISGIRSRAKLDEIVSIYSKATTQEKQEGYKLLFDLYPTETTRLEPLQK